ncbi:sigma factor [Salinicoccus sp. HZC-1]|uniref:sigma factor n=1 Tax=Salinicoccus sp. HZC-1 TaxID=3385497 RepID=UPI00398B1963
MYRIASFHFIIKESMDDKLDRLALQVYDGDMKAFDTIDQYLRPQVIRMSYKYSSTYNDREDVEQDMMESALRLCYRYECDLGRYRHYVMRSIRFEMISRIRDYNSARKKEYVRKDRSINLEVGDCADSDTVNPMDLLVKEEQLTYLLGDKSVCSPLEKKILTLFRNGWSIDGISEELKLKRKTVSNSLYRIRRKKERLVLDVEPGEPFDNMA